MNRNDKPEIERRIYVADGMELRAATEDKPPMMMGYAAKFDMMSEPMFGFREQIAPGAFDGVLEDDVRALFNHDPNHVLGRTASGTLRLSVDQTGLKYEVDLPDTQSSRDLQESMKRGDVSQSSFAFRVAPNGDTWDENDDGVLIRTITKFGKLYDVSPVTYPAYTDTEAGMRCLRAGKDAHQAGKQNAVAIKTAERARYLRLIG